VCNIWKAAGVFADIKNEINCGELSTSRCELVFPDLSASTANWDDYALAIFDDNYSNRPKQCRDADPENPVCQVVSSSSNCARLSCVSRFRASTSST